MNSSRPACTSSTFITAVEGLCHRHRGIAATTLSFQASGALYTGQIDLARRLAEQANQIAEPLGDYLRVGSTRSVLAIVHGLVGDLDGGLQLMQPVLQLIENTANDVFVPEMARTMGALHLWRGDAEQAATWFGREARSIDRGAETWLAAQSLPGLGAALACLGRFDKARSLLDRAVSAARGLGMPRILADALEQQAHLAVADDQGRAIELHHAALVERVEHRLRTFYVDSLEALATLGARAGEASAAVRVLAASDRARVHGLPAQSRPTADLRSDGRKSAGRSGRPPVHPGMGRRRSPEPRRGGGLRPSKPRHAPPAVHGLGQPHPHRTRRRPAGHRWPQQPRR